MKPAMLATVLLGLVVLPLGAQNMSETPHGKELPFSFGPFAGDIHRELGLSDSQVKQINTIFEANRRSVGELRSEVEKKETELQVALETGTIGLAQAEKAVDAVLEARGRLSKTQTMMMIQMRLVMTSDQWHKAVDIQRSTLRTIAASTPPAVDSTRPKDQNEFYSTQVLRTINTAQVTFAKTYNKGFADGLNRLGTPAAGGHYDDNHADLVDPYLAGVANGTNFTFTKYNYRFTFTPGPGSYGSIASYTLIGQPLEYGVSGKHSYYTDQTGIIHETTENRVATASDPAIASK